MPDRQSTLFGQIAISMKLATEAQVNECLTLQADYRKSGKKAPKIGKVLSVKGYVVEQQVGEILARQENVRSGKDAGGEASGGNTQKDEDDAAFSQRLATLENTKFGDFEVLKRLGSDSAGFTYKAKYIPSGTIVTLRVLSKETMEENPEYVKIFEEKIAKAKKLRHDNIQRVVAVGKVYGRDLYAAEYVTGVSLRRVLEARGQLDCAMAVDVATQIAKAFEYAHARGVYHQEIVPGNIVITSDRKVKVVGFGVARDVIGNFEKLAESEKEMPFYIAPEQITEGEDEEAICDARTDLYSLGAVLYHMLTGKPPFSGSTVKEVLANLTGEDLPDPTLLNPDISEALSEVLHTLLKPDSDERYQNATLLLMDLEALAASYGESEGDLEGVPETVALPAVAKEGSVRLRPRGRRRPKGDTNVIDKADAAARRKRRAGTSVIPRARESKSAFLLPVVSILGILIMVFGFYLANKHRIEEEKRQKEEERRIAEQQRKEEELEKQKIQLKAKEMQINAQTWGINDQNNKGVSRQVPMVERKLDLGEDK